MLVLRRIKYAITSKLEYRSILRHRSKLGRHLAPRYTAYLQRCRNTFAGDPAITPDFQRVVYEFDQKGFTSFWTAENQKLADAILARIQEEERRGLDIWNEDHRYREDIYQRFPEIEQLFQGPLGAFLTATYRAHFKIFYGVLFKSERLLDAPTGSQLWHADGGPGTCIIVMFYISDVAKEDGAMECLPWGTSLKIYKRELRQNVVAKTLYQLTSEGRVLSREELRKIKCDFYSEEIERSSMDRIEQPTGQKGLLVPFSNNILHKGGYPEPGRTRYACVFHCYPSDKPTMFDRYRIQGVMKRAPYPLDPAEDF